MTTIDKEFQSKITPAQALQMLKDGNHRFVNNLKVNRNLLQQVNETKEGQYPTAVILSCIDSRTSAELIFDQGLGDIFSIRIAGNVLNDDILGSMEFACKVAGAKIIAVLGHTNCGAIKGAVNGVAMGNLTQLLSKIQPAINLTMRNSKLQIHGAYGLADEVAENNVHLTTDAILDKSPILKEMVDNGEIGIVGGMYDVESGLVNFFEEDIRMMEEIGCRSVENE